mmetsp:Transcript_17280/g.51941  ORF Transcript_17280/g.51941 Transcript_17280/m.51941 type:complete len:210 (+) Transcript_17280:1821-2450(+)
MPMYASGCLHAVNFTPDAATASEGKYSHSTLHGGPQYAEDALRLRARLPRRGEPPPLTLPAAPLALALPPLGCQPLCSMPAGKSPKLPPLPPALPCSDDELTLSRIMPHQELSGSRPHASESIASAPAAARSTLPKIFDVTRSTTERVSRSCSAARSRGAAAASAAAEASGSCTSGNAASSPSAGGGASCNPAAGSCGSGCCRRDIRCC